MKNRLSVASVAGEMGNDWVIYALIAAYGGIVASVAWYVGEIEKLSFFARWTVDVENAARIPAILLLYVCVISVWTSPAKPAAEFWRRINGFFSPRTFAACGTIAALALFLGMFTAAKNLLPHFNSFVQNEEQIANLDVLLHGQAVWRYFQPPLDYLGLRRFIEFVYGPLWFLLVVGLPFVVVVFERLRRVRQPFLLTWLLCWILLGNLAASYFMSAGPVFYGKVTGDYDRFNELINSVVATKGLGFSAYDIQTGLWSAYEAKFSHLGTGISAFPSVHVSMATLIYLLSRQGSAALRASAAVFLLLIFIGSVYLGWHYAVDGYFSIAATVIIWNAVLWMHGERRFMSIAGRGIATACSPSAAITSRSQGNDHIPIA